MHGARSNRDNFTPLNASPAGNLAFGTSASRLKNMERHDQFKLAHDDVHSSLDNKVFGTLPDKRRWTEAHTISPSPQQMSGEAVWQRVNPLQDVNRVIRPTVVA